jgi:hypothetical protein
MEVCLMRRLSGVLLAVVLLALVSAPGSAQRDDDSWKNQWYWGAQGGYYSFQTPTRTTWYYKGYSVGGNWLITADRVGLFVSVDQITFEDGVTSAVANGSTVYDVALTGSRMVGGELVAMPSVGQNLLVLGGLGVSIQHLYDAQALGSFASPAEELMVTQMVDDAASKAFVHFSAGLQYNYQRWGIYGVYRLMPQADDYLITGEQHQILGGIRFALTGASEDVVLER